MPLSQVDLPAGRLAALQSAGLTGIRLIGQTQGFAFYAFDLKNNRQCYDAVRQTTARIVGGIMRCSSNPTGPTFPSPERPVVDLSLVGADAGQPIHTIQLAGIAADGIAAVAVLGSDGNVYGKTQVVGNVYVSTGLPPQADGPVITYDASGATIWCFPYVAPKFPTSVLHAAGCQPFPTNATGRWVNPNRTSTTSTR